MSPSLAKAIAIGLYDILTISTTVATSDTGGQGTGAGFMQGIVAPTVTNFSIIASQMKANGMVGESSINMTSALSSAFAKIFSMASIISVHPVVGTGTASAKCTTESVSSFSLLTKAFVANGIIGPDAPKLAKIIADSVCIILSGTITTVPILGSSNGVPMVGIGSGRII